MLVRSMTNGLLSPGVKTKSLMTACGQKLEIREARASYFNYWVDNLECDKKAGQGNCIVCTHAHVCSSLNVQVSQGVL